MSFQKCKKCGEYGWSESHRCAPQWNAICPDCDDADAPEKAFGSDAKEAALYFAEQNFSRLDYPENCEIWVKKEDETEWQKFDITVEAIPSFYATQKEKEKI